MSLNPAGAGRLGLLALAAALACAAGPSLAQPAAAPAAAGGDAQLAKGKQLFVDYGCGSCHSLAAAGAEGHVGPAFDGNSNLSAAYIQQKVANGSGPMPAFGDQMSADEIKALAAYILQSKK